MEKRAKYCKPDAEGDGKPHRIFYLLVNCEERKELTIRQLPRAAPLQASHLIVIAVT
jgi:hypothetical protein